MHGPPQTGKVHLAGAGRVQDNAWLTPTEPRKLDASTLTGAECTDAGDAERIVALFGDRIRFVKGWGWLVWDACKWSPDDTGAVVRFALETARQTRRAAVEMDNRDQAGKVFSRGLQLENGPRYRAALEAASAHALVRMRPQDFDQDPDVVNAPNSIIDLRSGILLPSDPREYMTHCLAVPYDPAAECPRWEAFIMEICLGDEDLAQYLQESIGYSLTGHTSEECLWLLYGVGSNGKSTLLKTLYQHVFGDYGMVCSFNLFLQAKYGNDPARFGFADWPGKRWVMASESNPRGAFNEESIKGVTSGDPMRAERKGQDAFEFTPTAKIWLATNDKPGVDGTNDGIWRRFRPMPFRAQFKGTAGDKDLNTKLAAEAPGILAWAVRGAMGWYERGNGGRGLLRMPAVVEEACKEYRSQQDAFAMFLEERCIVGEGEWCSRSVLREAFNAWLKNAGLPKKTPSAIYDAVRASGFIDTKYSGDRAFKGFRVWGE